MIKSLSYVGFSSPNADAWQTFGPDILGLEIVSSPDEAAVRLRMDEATWRIAIMHGETNDIEFIGWDVGNETSLADAITQLEASDIEVRAGDVQLAAARNVSEIAWFIDPFGFRHELTFGQRHGDTPFKPGHDISRFVTGEGGLGHIVLMVPDLEVATDFYVRQLGFRHSDDIESGLKIRFLHCNSRHHTVALVAVPGHKGVHHVMLEVEQLDDVGRAYDRANAAGVPIAMTLGKHPNDKMTSFYVRSPSGFEIEFGTGGRLMDMNEHSPAGHYEAMSIWGHKPPAEPLRPGILKPVDEQTGVTVFS